MVCIVLKKSNQNAAKHARIDWCISNYIFIFMTYGWGVIAYKQFFATGRGFKIKSLCSYSYRIISLKDHISCRVIFQY